MAIVSKPVNQRSHPNLKLYFSLDAVFFLPGRGQTEWWKCAIALENSKDWQGLLDWSRNWTKKEPEFVGAWFVLGNTPYRKLDRNSDAIEAFLQALRLNPEDTYSWYVWYHLGNAYQALNRYNDAIDVYRQGLRINSQDAEAWFSLRIASNLSGNRTAALEAVRELRRLNPKMANNLFDNIVLR